MSKVSVMIPAPPAAIVPAVIVIALRLFIFLLFNQLDYFR